jgi:hypothetical protein
MSTEEVEPAEKCALHIYESGVYHLDYAGHCDQGKNPKEHILWSAAQALGLIEADGFEEEYQVWDNKQTAKMRIRGTW